MRVYELYVLRTVQYIRTHLVEKLQTCSAMSHSLKQGWHVPYTD